MNDALETKLRRFIAGQLIQESTPISRSDLGQAAIRTAPKHPNLALEEGSALSSPILGHGPCFLGAYSYINDGGYIRCEGAGVFVGRYCSIGRRVTIGAGMHKVDGLSTSPSLRGVQSRRYTADEASRIAQTRRDGPLVIHSDVWIGDGAVVLPGVVIGTGAVIGANAVVTHDVAPYQIVGGVPARLIRQRFPDDIVSALLASRWWNASQSDLNATPLANVIEFLELSPLRPHAYPTYRCVEAA